MSPTLRRVLAASAVLMVIVASAGVAFAMWLPSEGGRRFVASRLEQIISDQLPGSLRVGSIDALTPQGVRARDLVFTDPEGETVISVSRVEMAIDYAALAQGTFHSTRSFASGGVVMLTTDAEGQLRIDRAFEGPAGGPGPTGRDIVALENLVARDVDVQIRISDAPRAHVHASRAVLQIRAPEGGSALLSADGIRASARIEAPAPIELRIARGTLRLDGDARERARLVLPAHVGDAEVDVRVDITSDASESMSVAVTLRPHGIGAFFGALPTIGQTLIAEVGSDAFDVTVEMDGL